PAPVIRRTPLAPAPIATPRPVEAARPEPTRVLVRRPLAEPSTPLLQREMSVPVLWLLIGLIAVGCLVALAFVVGQRCGGTDRLPDVPKHPTMSEIREGPVTPDLVAKGPTHPAGPTSPAVSPPPGIRPVAPPKDRPAPMFPTMPIKPAVADKAGPAAAKMGGPEKPATTETPGAPLFRVRVAQLAVSQPDAIDKLRGFLLQKDIETELERSKGFYVLYSRDKLPDKKTADELAVKINKQLEAFEKATKIPTSKTAYVMQITKE
ncbi:MAG: hypothetical protein NT049_10865, partial [Planctomycetota bacterium]|nr:hypothetical protein [Planctomycetota bacterium]